MSAGRIGVGTGAGGPITTGLFPFAGAGACPVLLGGAGCVAGFCGVETVPVWICGKGRLWGGDWANITPLIIRTKLQINFGERIIRKVPDPNSFQEYLNPILLLPLKNAAVKHSC